MRVLFLTHRLPFQPNRGDRIRAYHLLRRLGEFAEVDLVSLVHDDEEAAQIAGMSGLASTVTGVRANRARNLARIPAYLLSTVPMTHVLLDSGRLRQTLTSIVEAHPPDVILGYCSGVARLALEPPLNRLPLVLDMVDVDSEKWRELGQRNGALKGWIYRREARTLRRVEQHLADVAAVTLVINDRERALLTGLQPRARVRVVQNGVDFAGLAPTEAPGPSSDVVFCGVMNYEPNEAGSVWLAREVWPLVRAERPDARLCLVGSDPTSRVRSLGQYDASITVTGRVPDVRPYLWNAAVAAAPLHVARGLQNKVLEALAAGLPCVVTPAVQQGLPPEALAGCIERSDPASFARGILELLALSPADRRQRAHSANLSALAWSERLAHLDCIMREACAAPPPAASGH